MEVNNNLKEKYSSFEISNKLFLDDRGEDELIREKIVIPAKQKILILSELDRIYKINKHVVYPELDKYSEYIKDSEQIQEKVNQYKIEQAVQAEAKAIVDFINLVLSKIDKLDKQIDSVNEENIEVTFEVSKDVTKGSPYRTLIEQNNLKQLKISYGNLQVFLVYKYEGEILIVGFQIEEDSYFFSELIDDFIVEDIINIEQEKTIIRVNKENSIVEPKELEWLPDDLNSTEAKSKIKEISKHTNELKENWQEIKSELLAINESDFKDIEDEIYNILCNYLSFGRKNDIARCNIHVKRYLKEIKPEKYEQLYSQYMHVVEKVFISETA